MQFSYNVHYNTDDQPYGLGKSKNNNEDEINTNINYEDEKNRKSVDVMEENREINKKNLKETTRHILDLNLGFLGVNIHQDTVAVLLRTILNSTHNDFSDPKINCTASPTRVRAPNLSNPFTVERTNVYTNVHTNVGTDVRADGSTIGGGVDVDSLQKERELKILDSLLLSSSLVNIEGTGNVSKILDIVNAEVVLPLSLPLSSAQSSTPLSLPLHCSGQPASILLTSTSFSSSTNPLQADNSTFDNRLQELPLFPPLLPLPFSHEIIYRSLR